ncbi:Imm30 family immunity protein [Tychonema sp. BBK16]|uniref:Imm30 family immunity protein n=1 Tax=Tychonema sp. BBK16 TaxID=2699888 RepID=UPI001EEC2497|nr:Imm30 family immunity protein [Tychonema sp. BBK16]MCF6372881.1 immunity 30 family protein [Tychonema sp. BBK16]
MKKNIWINILEANKLMRSPDEVIAFENALTSLADRPQDEDLPDLHLILDDRCEQPEVMFGLIHFLESFDVSAQLQAFVTVVPQLMLVASEWTRILHTRILNDEDACRLYRDILHSLNPQEPNFVRQLLEESASYHLNQREPKLELAR